MDSKILSSSKINPTKLLGGSSFANNTNNISEKLKEDSITISKSDLSIIKGQVFEIKNLVTNLTTLKKKRLKTERKETERERFDKREKELEKKKKPEDNKIKLPQAPKLGFLDIIRRFVVNTLIGFIAIRLIKHLPKMIEVVKFLGGAMDFITNVGGNLLNGLATFVQKGYEAYDFTRKTLKTFGGDNAVKLFDGFNNALGGIVTAALAASFALFDMAGGDSSGSDNVGIKGRTPGRSRRGIDPKLARRYTERFGRDAATRKFGQEGVRSLGGKYSRSGAENLARRGVVSLAGKGGTKAVLGVVRPLLKRLPIIGALIDFGLSVALGEDPGRAAFKAIGAGLLGSIGTAVGSLAFGFGAVVGGILGSIGGDAIGGALYDLFFGNKKPEKQKVAKAAGGGQAPVTRGGKIVSGPRRSITKSKVKRQIAIQPTPLKPGESVGGDFEVQKVFPRSEYTGEVSPLDYIEQTYKKTSDDRLFGPLLNLQTKSLVGQIPNKLDYRNAAQGLSNWMNMTFSDEILRTGSLYAAGGGQIDAELLARKSGDMTDAIARSLEDSISKRMSETVRDLMKQMTLLEPEYYDDDYDDYDDYDGEEGDGGGGGEGSGTPGEWGPILDIIKKAEMGRGGYESMNPSTRLPGATNMTIGEVSRRASGAVGAYQFLPDTTLLNAMRGAGLKKTDLFSRENQDKMAVWLITKARKVSHQMIKDNPDQAMIRLGMEWAGLPMPKNMRGHRGPVNAGQSYYAGDGRNAATVKVNEMRAAFAKLGGVSGGSSSGGRIAEERGETSIQGYNLKQVSHPETGSGWTVEGQTDGYNPPRPIVFSREGADAFARMIKDSGGIVTGKDIASSQRSRAKNDAVKGAQNSTHLFGRGMDIHGRSRDWIKANGGRYGWNWAPYGGPGDHGGHFEFSGSGGGSEPTTTPRSTSRTTGRTTTGGRNRGSRRSGSRRSGSRRSGSSGSRRSVVSQSRSSSTQTESQQSYNFNGKDKKIYLHWNAGSPNDAPSNYHTSILGDGTIRRVTPYDNDSVPHTWRRNSNAIGLSVSGMAGASPNNFGKSPIKPIQYQKMAEEVAKIANSMGWSSSDINIKNVMTHAEAGANKDGRTPHPNYGPSAWGGTGERRWDLYKLYQQDPDGSGGDKIRNIIKSRMGSFFRGGFVPKDGLYDLHKGEFVVDKDSVDLVGKNFIATINAIENKTQLQQKAGSLIGHLSYITGYEPGGQQQVVVEMPEPEVIPMMMPVPIGGEGCSGGGGSEYDSDRDGLYAQG
jgi:hypothetical protein